MKKFILSAIIAIASVISVSAQNFYQYGSSNRSTRNSYGTTSRSSRSSFGTTNPSVRYQSGYIRSNGTYVSGHWKTNSNSTNHDNFSTQYNANPYTVQLEVVRVITLLMPITMVQAEPFRQGLVVDSITSTAVATRLTFQSVAFNKT